MLNQAFDALKSHDWGTDRKLLDPIDRAVVTTDGDSSARAELEERLASVLRDDVSRDARDFVCRKLMVIGTAASVPSLAKLLHQPEDSHMARYALERIPAPEAAEALREALPRLSGDLKIGVIGSLGVRKDEASVDLLAGLLDDADSSVAASAACALGAIRSAKAASALAKGKPKSESVKLAAIDASLACAESLLGDGKAAQALVIYKGLAGQDQPKHIRLAATRGMLACASKRG